MACSKAVERSPGAAGPGPGDRVPELEAHDEDDELVLDLLKGTKHKLFLFDGVAPTEAGYASLSAIATEVEQRYGDHVAVSVIAPHAERPAALTRSRAMKERSSLRS